MIDRFRRVLWFCAGIDRSLAQSLRTEHVALASVGATVLLTAILAFVSGSYALYFVFGSKGPAIAFGCFWATIIFNLDRFIVSSIRKQGDRLADIVIAAPRAMMALIISIVIIVPLELWLFRAEIEKKLPEDAIEQQRAYAAAVERGPLQSSIDQIGRRIEGVQQGLNQLEKRREEIYREGEGAQLAATINLLGTQTDELVKSQDSATSRKAEFQRRATEEYQGLGPSGQKGAGPQYRALMARAMEEGSTVERITAQLRSTRIERENASSRLDGLANKTRIESLRSELEAQEKKREDLVEKKRDLLDSAGPTAKAIQPASLLTRLTIVHKLAGENATADWTITLLRLLIALVELSPILVKLMCSRGPYDALRDAAEREEVLEADLRKLKAEIEYQKKANEIRQSQSVSPTETEAAYGVIAATAGE